jgi:putative transposase
MARLPRLFLPGQPIHAIQRGYGGESIFGAEEDGRYYLECLGKAAGEQGLAIHAYVLMSNHVHLLVTPKSQDSLSRTLQSVGRRYVQYFNYAYDRSGTLFDARYKSTLIQSSRYLLTCMRYIELNPVRAGMVKRPDDYPWSSYRTNAEGDENALLTPHALYRKLGATPEARQDAYRQLFRAQIPKEELEAIRNATNKAWVLGDGRFCKKVEALSQRRASPLPKGRPRVEEE